MIDDIPFNNPSAARFIRGHESMLWSFLEKRVKREDYPWVVEKLMMKPITLASMLSNNYQYTEDERMDIAVDKISRPGTVTVMIGSKGSGKTATGFWAFEKMLERRIKPVWIGYSPEIEKKYPEIEQTLDTKKLEKCVAIADEAAVFTMGRDAMNSDQRDKMRQLFTCRHRDYSVIYMTQTFRIDILILNLMDLVWYKKFGNMDFDRNEASGKFSDAHSYMKPIRKEENLVIDMNNDGALLFNNPLPERWTEALSKPFSMLSKEDAIKYMKMLEATGMKSREANMWLSQRGWDLNSLSFETGINPPGPKKPPETPNKWVKCPRCGSLKLEKHDKKRGKQRGYCTDCNRTFVEGAVHRP